jgi:hypothetical protein
LAWHQKIPQPFDPGIEKEILITNKNKGNSSQETAFLRTRARYWPVKDAQLREIAPEEFNENV